jgi:hypothetical protein
VASLVEVGRHHVVDPDRAAWCRADLGYLEDHEVDRRINVHGPLLLVDQSSWDPVKALVVEAEEVGFERPP